MFFCLTVLLLELLTGHEPHGQTAQTEVIFVSKMASQNVLCCFAPTVNLSYFILEVLTVGITLCDQHLNTSPWESCRANFVAFLSAVDPPSDLRFKILNENTVQMTWRRPQSRIQGYRIQVTSATGGCWLHLQVLSCSASNITSVINPASLCQLWLSAPCNYLKMFGSWSANDKNCRWKRNACK